MRNENDRLNKLVKTQEHLSDAVKAKDVEISDLNKQLSTTLESYGEKIKRLQDENEKMKINSGINAKRDLDYENLLQKYKVSEALLDVYKKLLRNTLQSAQGMIDMSINSMSQLELMEGGKFKWLIKI